ncbi:MAG: 23S rRNA (uracil(1939)-C(5))-methyltransferase RlmD [Candidatus Omnitrophica bacterium]|nr:23S rRNA (uracil(1939)-C(5))-methyltransferase RlmD [Candidatus Omnitrophota bacterium]
MPEVTPHHNAPEAERVEPRCPYFGSCGGCRFQDIAYAEQVARKHRRFTEQLSDVVPAELLEEAIFCPSKAEWRYRNKMEFSFSPATGELALGMHKSGSYWNVIDVEDCLISPEPFGEVMSAVRDFAARSGIDAYSSKKKSGFWRHLTLRWSETQAGVMALLITTPGERGVVDPLFEGLLRDIPCVRSLYWGINSKISDVAIPDELIHIGGEEFLIEEIDGVKLRVYPLNFFQPNLSQTRRIYRDMASLLPRTESLRIVDLYCGTGAIGLYLAFHAPGVSDVIGVEQDEGNIASAQANKEANGITEARFVATNIENRLKEDMMFLRRFSPGLIVLDPPRPGLHKKVYGPLVESGARYIFYLSCNIKSLSFDLQQIFARSRDYEIRHIGVYDMFPHTPHFETLVILEKQVRDSS